MKQLIAMVVFLVGISEIFSQTHLPDPEASASPETKAIMARVHGGEINALLELGRTGDTNAIPILEKCAADTDPNWEGRRAAVPALIELKAESYFDKRIEELKIPKHQRDITAVERAFTVLSHMNTKEATRVIAKYLFDDTNPPKNIGDVGCNPVRETAAMTLWRMIPDRPVKTPYPSGMEEDIAKWRDWWQQNKSKYE
jgi:HEAT repeat protein